MRPEDVVAIDSETTLILPGVKAPPLVCVSVSTHEGEALASHTEPELVSEMCELFETKHMTLANAPFDIGVFMRYDDRLIKPMFDALDEDRVHCVQMRERLIDLGNGTYNFYINEEGEAKRKSYSLDAIARRRGKGSKHVGGFEWRLKYHDLYGKSLDEYPAAARDYAMVDAKLTRDIHLDQPETGNVRNATAQVRAHVALHLASCRGIRTDNDNVVALREQCEEWIEKIRPILEEEKLLRPDGSRNTKRAVRRMIDRLGKNCTLTTSGEERLLEKHGGDMDEFLRAARKNGTWVSVASPACMESGDYVLKLYGIHGKLSNMLNGTVKHLEKGTYLPIQTYFDPLMETGRTSSSGPNIQNQRRGIDLPHPFEPQGKLKFRPDPRECFVAREGYVFLAADYSGAENHTLAQACKTLFGFSKMADALNSDQNDLHIWVASLLMKQSYEETQAQYVAEEAAGVYGPASQMRQLAKVANFGFPGGCGPATLVAFARGMGVDIDVHTAAKLKRVWLATWPEMVWYFEYVGQCVNIDGWHYVDHVGVPRVRGRATFTAACNTIFSGLASDAAKAAIWEVSRRQYSEPKSNLFGTYMVNFIHDELILEVPYRKLEPAARELQEVMCEQFNKFTPDVPVSTSTEAMIHWTKKGQKVFNENQEFVWDFRKAV